MRRGARHFVVWLVGILVCAGCGTAGTPPNPDNAGTQSTPTPAPAPVQADAGMASAPEWRKGDRWVYEWTSGAEHGTRTVEVADVAPVNGVDYYVVEIGPTSQQYYTKTLHFAASVQASRVLARMV